MTVFLLSEDHSFPPPEMADENGLLAVGGDLSEKRLLLAYSEGIFPWFTDDSPILWWAPDPRLVLLPDEFKVGRSLRQLIKQGVFTVTIDNVFDRVVKNCATVHRAEDNGTWITDEMIAAYSQLHKSGHAHSVEAWHEGELVGGLYGVSLGRAFFGESMFSLMSNASKVALAGLVQKLREWEFGFIDCQVTTQHLKSLGAREIPRSKFMKMLKMALKTLKEPARWKEAKNERII